MPPTLPPKPNEKPKVKPKAPTRNRSNSKHRSKNTVNQKPDVPARKDQMKNNQSGETPVVPPKPKPKRKAQV